MTAILLAITVSVDALGVGLSFGIRNVKIRLPSAAVICLFSVLYAALAVAFGNVAVRFLPPFAAKAVGAGILCLMGLYVAIFRGLRAPKETACAAAAADGSRKTVFQWAIKSLGVTICIMRDPKSGDVNHSGSIELSEALMLGLALSVDVLGAGIGFALTDGALWYFPVLVGVVQIAFLYAGCLFGGSLGRRMNERAVSVLSGLVLFAVGILKFF